MTQDQRRTETTPGYERETPSEPHVAEAGERIVLNGTGIGDDVDVRRLADALLDVARRSVGADRPEVERAVRTALGEQGRSTEQVEVERFTDSVLRGARSSIVVQTDDGQMLGTFESPLDDNERAQPQVSDPADEDRPFFS